MSSDDNSQNNMGPQQSTKKVEKFLPEDTPIAMLWFVKDPSDLKDDQLPLPDNQGFEFKRGYPYKRRLLNWADSEPDREINLYYVPFGSNGKDLNKEQIQKFHDLANPEKGGRSNIKVVDCYDRFKDKYDLEFLTSNKIPFSWKVDIMRLIMLMKDGPLVYFDFDVLPVKEQIGKIKMNDTGYKMCHLTPSSDDLENSVIAVDSKNNFIVSAIYNTMKYVMNNEEFLNQMNNDHSVWYCHLAAVTHVYNRVHNSQVLNQEELEQELKKWIHGEQVKSIDDDKQDEYFSCYGGFHVISDESWNSKQCDLYRQEEKKIQATITIVNEGNEEKLRLSLELNDESIVVQSKNSMNEARYTLYAEYNGDMYIIAGENTRVKDVTKYAVFPIDFIGHRSKNRIETSDELSKMKEMLNLSNGKRSFRVDNIFSKHIIVSSCDVNRGDIYKAAAKLVETPSPTTGTPTTNPTSKQQLPRKGPVLAIEQPQSPNNEEDSKPPEGLLKADKRPQPPIPIAHSDNRSSQNCFPKLNWFYIAICINTCVSLTMLTLGVVGGDDLTVDFVVGAIVGSIIFGAIVGGLIGKCVSDPEVSQLNNGLGKQ